MGTNSSEVLKVIAVEIVHIFLVIIPSVLLSSFLLYCLHRLKKVFVVRSLFFLYVCMAIICIIGPISYRILAFAYDLHYTGPENHCTALYAVVDYLFIVGQTMLCVCVGMIAAVQFLAISAKLKGVVSLKKVAVTFFLLLVVVLCVNAVFFPPICIHENKNPSFHKAMLSIILGWTLVFFLIPLLATIIFSILTYLRVKRNVLETERAVLHSVVLVSTFNVTSFASIRVLAMMLYLISILVESDEKLRPGSTEWYLSVVALIIANLAYPFSVLTVFVANSKLRKMFYCSQGS